MDKDNNIPTTPAELLFQLGKLRVYHFPTMDDLVNNNPPNSVFWTDLSSGYTYGPFPSIYEAMQNYTWHVHNQHANKESEGKEADIIYVDFVKKRRIIFEVP